MSGDGNGHGTALDLKRYAPPSKSDMAAWQDEMRAAFFEAVNPDDMRAIVRKLVERAREGDLAAVKLLLAYGIGPAQVNVKNAVIVQGGPGGGRAPPRRRGGGRARGSLPPWVHDRVRGNLGLVRHLARGYLGRGVDAEDLVQEGVFGLIRAAEKFDPARRGRSGRPVRFSTYAALWIRHFFRRAVLLMGPPVRMSVRASGDARRLLAGRLDPGSLGPGRRARALDAARAMGPAPAVVLEEISARPGDGTEAAGPDPEEGARLAPSLAALSEVERAVVTAYFGLGGGPPRTLRGIGEALGLSPASARRIKGGAMTKLRLALSGGR